jgi:hypothetical protein
MMEAHMESKELTPLEMKLVAGHQESLRKGPKRNLLEHWRTDMGTII